MPSHSPDAIVVGAGLSGLTTAWYLAEAGARVRIVEAAAAPGGLIRTSRRAEGVVETAARGFIWTDRVAALFAAVGIAPMFSRDSSKRRFIFRNGLPRRWPLGPFETINLAAHGALAAVSGGFKPRAGETVAAWANRSMGSGAANWLIAPAMQGIYASPTDQLSAQAVFGGGRLRGRLAAPPGGMAELFDRIRIGLIERKATFEFGASVSELAAVNPDRVPMAICTEAASAAPLVAPHAPRLAEAIARIRMTSLLSVTAFYPESRDDVSGFGVLFPRPSGIKALGVLFNSDMFDDRSSMRSETWIYGDQSADVVVKIQQSLASTLRHDRLAASRRDTEPTAVYPTPQIARLPIYDERVLDVAARLGDLPPWMGLCGNYLGKLGVSAIVETAYKTAKRLKTT